MLSLPPLLPMPRPALLQAELTAAQAALPGRAALAASLRLGRLRERVHLLNRRAAEIEVGLLPAGNVVRLGSCCRRLPLCPQ